MATTADALEKLLSSEKTLLQSRGAKKLGTSKCEMRGGGKFGSLKAGCLALLYTSNIMICKTTGHIWLFFKEGHSKLDLKSSF